MGLYENLQNDMKSAMKSGETVKLSVLRMLISAIRLLEIDKKLKKAEDADVSQILQKQIKQHKDSIEQFEKGNRKDLADKERLELTILEAYMPKQMGEDELTAMVKEVIAQTGAASKADMGKVMKAVLEKAQGRTDGKSVNQIVMKLLLTAIFCFITITAYGATDDATKKETFVQRARSFIQRLIDYPANVLQGSANVVSNTGKQGAAIVTKEAKRVGQVVTGDLSKTKEVVTEPLTGTAETVLNTAGDAGKVPVEAALSGKAYEPEEKSAISDKAENPGQKVINYPADVTQGVVSVAADTGKRGTEIVTNEIKRIGQVATGEADKSKDMIVEPLTGTAETALKAIEETGKVPVEAAKE